MAPHRSRSTDPAASSRTDECLNQNWFISLSDARAQIEAWRLDYNLRRPHSALGHRTPHEFASEAAGLRSPSAHSAPPPPALKLEGYLLTCR